MAFPVMEVLGLVFKPIVDLIDDLTLSPEEKLTIKSKLFSAQLEMYAKVLDYEARIAEAASRIIAAEASSESWLTSNWRPLVMVTFTGLVVARWFGVSVPLPPELEVELFSIIKIGIAGYIGGRSAEKIADSVGHIFKEKTEA